MSESPRPQIPTGARIAIDLGPLLLFLVVSGQFGIYVGTGAFMVAILIALAVGWRVEGKLAILPLVTAIFVIVFGGLTLWFHDDTFIKVKVTAINALFGGILLGGLCFGRSFIKQILGASFQLDEAGWRKLTLRWGLFFFALAGLNELVWRNVETQMWVNFKFFGVTALSMGFMFAQMPLIKRHSVEGAE
jgi:intracellular septation protein